VTDVSTAPSRTALGFWSRTELVRRWRGLVLLLLLAVPVALTGLLLLALPPARRAARLRTAEVLRAE
jgi:ABC-type lipoprotein release transport system permease subunit